MNPCGLGGKSTPRPSEPSGAPSRSVVSHACRGAEWETRRTCPDPPRSSGPGLGLVGRHIRGSQIISDWVRGTEPGGRPCETWPLALRGPMTGTHGVCVSNVSQRHSSSLRKERSRRVARTSFTGEGGTGCAVLGRAAEVARVRVAPREVTGIIQPGRPSVSPDTPA